MKPSKSLSKAVALFLTTVGFACNTEQPTTVASSYFNDAEIESRIDSIMNLMTIQEKIGQLVLYTSHYTSTGPTLPKNVEEAIMDGTCGNIFNANVAEYNLELQKMAVEESRLGIPLLFGLDVIHGMKTIFPINLGLSCSWDATLIEQTARVAAREAIASGINWTYSPMVDITRDPRWGRVSEGSGEDSYLGSIIAAAMVKGYQGNDLSADSTILACVKHFAAYGAPQAGRDYHTVDITDRTLRETYLPTYKAAIDAGAGSVMTSFNEIDATPATASEYIMNTILRKEWGFRGFVVTDYTAINELIPHGVAADSSQAGVLAINAGVNMDMEGNIYHNYLKDAVDAGVVKREQIDQMCREVLRVKFALGLFDDPYKYNDTTKYKTEDYCPANLAVARDAARKSFVLLKNDKQTLPIANGKHIALIGPFVDAPRDMMGSWFASGDDTKVTTILSGFKERFGADKVVYAKGTHYEGDDRSGFAQALSVSAVADITVMAVGLPGAWSGEATSLTSIEIPNIQKELIKAIRASGKPLILLLVNGRPLDLSTEVGLCDAMLEIWYPGTQAGQAVADVVSGDYNPSGKLTMTFPRTLGQVPIHYDMKSTGRPCNSTNAEQHYLSKYMFTPNSPLFSFGYGLSYTSFEYSDIKTSKSTIKNGESMVVTATIKNSGAFDGTETVQLYIRDIIGSVTRPVKQLKGFEKLYLKAGQSQTVEFTIDSQMLSFLRKDMTVGTEPGEFMVWIGGSSEATLSTKCELVL